MRICKDNWLNTAFSLFAIGLILIAGGCGVSVAGSVLVASETVQLAQAKMPEVKRSATSETRRQQRRLKRRQQRQLRRQQDDGQLRVRRHAPRTLGGSQIYRVRKKRRTQRLERLRHRELRRQQQFGPPLSKRQGPILSDRSQRQFKKLRRAQRRERRLERRLRRLKQPVTPRIRRYERRKDGSGQYKFRRRKGHDRRHRYRRHRSHPNIYLEPYPYWDYVPPVYGKLSCEAARQKLIRRGYDRVRAYDCIGNVYGFRARKNGCRYKIRVSAIHGYIISLMQY